MKRVLWFLACATILSSTPLWAQSGVITDNQGGYATFQDVGAGNYSWQNSQGGSGFIFMQPSLGAGSGFGQGLLQGLQRSQSFYLRAQELKLQQDFAKQQQKRMETEEQIQQLQLQLLQQQLTPSSSQSRLSAPPASTLSDAQIEEMAREQARQDAVAERMMTMTPAQREWAQMGMTAMKEGLLNVNPANDRLPCVPMQAWLDDHQHYWGGTRPEAVLAYFRSGHHDCP